MSADISADMSADTSADTSADVPARIYIIIGDVSPEVVRACVW